VRPEITSRFPHVTHNEFANRAARKAAKCKMHDLQRLLSTDGFLPHSMHNPRRFLFCRQALFPHLPLFQHIKHVVFPAKGARPQAHNPDNLLSRITSFDTDIRYP
jgi:hypothetical protein